MLIIACLVSISSIFSSKVLCIKKLKCINSSKTISMFTNSNQLPTSAIFYIWQFVSDEAHQIRKILFIWSNTEYIFYSNQIQKIVPLFWIINYEISLLSYAFVQPWWAGAHERSTKTRLSSTRFSEIAIFFIIDT